MNRIFSLLKDMSFIRKFSIIVGLLAVISLIWLVAPYIGLHSVTWRLIIILVLVIAVASFYAIRYWYSKKQGDALAKDITEQQQANAMDVSELKQKMQRAVASLRSSELGVGRGASVLYSLPWYMVIGPSAAGKTTLLRNSGLKFPLASDEDVRVTGYGGTRNCDWWFSDQAVIIDTAGRYTTEVNDQKEWVAFLNILKKRRRKLPINGVIVAISLSELLTSDAEGLNWHANVVRDRIEELTKHLGYILPINVVLTKSDQLKGFTEFFNHFSHEEREQVWGFTLEGKENALLDTLQQKFSELYQRLTDVRIEQLAIEQKRQAKADLHDFPSQYKKASEKLYQFFERLINDNPYQNHINLNGVYFTSGCQEGHTVQRDVMITDAQFEQASEIEYKAGDSYFIRRLLLDVIFANQFGAILSRRMRLLRDWLKGIFIVAGSLAVIISLLLWSFAYVHSRQLLDDSVTAVDGIKKVLSTGDARPQSLIAAQLQLYHQYQTVQDYKQLPWYKRLGLYQGQKQLSVLSESLLNSLQKNFMRTVPPDVQNRLAHYNENWHKMSAADRARSYENYYQTLKDYLLLGLQSPSNDNTMDAKYLANVWALQMTRRHHSTADVSDINAEQLEKLSRFYINSTKTGLSPEQLTQQWHPNIDMVEVARKNLYRPLNARNIYRSVSLRLNNELHPISLGDLVKGEHADLLQNSDTIAGMYSKAAWLATVSSALQQAAEQASSGDWVLSAAIGVSDRADVKPQLVFGKRDASTAQRIGRALRTQYFSEYINAWYHWLREIRPSQFVSLQDASQGLLALAGSDGPLSELMHSVAVNINLPISESNSDTASELIIPFQPLRKFANSEVNMPSLDKYLHDIKTVSAEMKALSVDPNSSKKAKTYAVNILRGSAGDKQLYKTRTDVSRMLVDVKNQQAKHAIDNVLVTPLRAAWQALLYEAAKDLQVQWENQVLPNYQNNIVGNFPFQHDSDQDSDIDGVRSFFGLQNGALWQFVRKDLQNLVVRKGLQWRANSWLGVAMPFSPDFLPGLDQAQQISTVLFSRSETNPSYSISVYPIPLVDISDSVLNINGKAYHYRNGPQQWHTLNWHAQDNQQMSQLIVNRRDGEAQAQISGSGIWGFIKLLNTARITRVGSGYSLRWHLHTSDGRYVTLSMRFRTNGSASLVRAFVDKPFELPNRITEDDQ